MSQQTSPQPPPAASPGSLATRRPAQVSAAEIPGVQGLTMLMVGVVIIAALYFGREVLIPIVLAVLLSFVLVPLVALLQRLRLPRVPAALLAVAVALGVILALGGMIGTQIAQLVTDIPRYQTVIQPKVEAVRALTVGRMSEMMRQFGHEMDNAAAPKPQASAAPRVNSSPSLATDAAKPIPVEVHPPNPSPLELAQRILEPVLSPLATTGIVFVVAIFILLQQEDLRDRLIRLFGSSDLHRTTMAMDDAARRLSKYFLTQLAINAGFGVLIGLGLALIGVPSAALWGVIAALLRFVPYIGSIASAVLPILLGAAVDPGWSTAIEAALLFVVLETATGQMVEPLVYGHSTGLSPFAVIIAAIFWGWLWGGIGLILSTPLTLCLVVLGRHVTRLEFLDVLLGDRPALTPVENFYQRMLSGDAEETLRQAETLLKDCSLTSYYDEVAIPGLKLAANDAIRGVLTEAQLSRLQGAVDDLIHDLAHHSDVDPSIAPTGKAEPAVAPPAAERALEHRPPPKRLAPAIEQRAPAWRSDRPVLCIARNGPLDGAVAMILAQLLDRHGLGAAVVSSDAVAPAMIEQLDTANVAMACIVFLDVSSSSARLRYLVRRLRQRLGAVPIVTGLWPAGDGSPEDRVRHEAVASDFSATSLHDAVEACLDAVYAGYEAAEAVTA